MSSYVDSYRYISVTVSPRVGIGSLRTAVNVVVHTHLMLVDDENPNR